MQHKVPMTARGAELLAQELEQLEKIERPRIVLAIAEARAHGDLKENAEYHAAKEEQGLVEARIRLIKSRLSHAQVIDVTQLKNEGKVVFGATVHLLNTDTEKEQAYQLVGEDEANLRLNKISINSPIARALISKQVGDEVEVQAPTGKVYYEILKVEYI